jgi:hypothetical protein
LKFATFVVPEAAATVGASIAPPSAIVEAAPNAAQIAAGRPLNLKGEWLRMKMVPIC